MACYGVETNEIERLSGLVRDVPAELTLNADPDMRARMAEEYRDLLLEVARQFISAFFCFLRVMHAIMDAKLRLEEDSSAARRPGRRQYLWGFLKIYQRACSTAQHLLSSLLEEMFNESPEFCAEFVAQMVASETVAEMSHFTASVPTAESADEAAEHGEVGKEVTDSIKRFLRAFLNWLPLGRKKYRQERVERALDGINEILSMLFKAGAAAV